MIDEGSDNTEQPLFGAVVNCPCLHSEHIPAEIMPHSGISLEISVTFEENFKPSKSLEVLVCRSEKNATWKSQDGRTHRWVPAYRNLFPRDTLTVRPRGSRIHHRSWSRRLDELVLTAEDLLEGCCNDSGQITSQSLSSLEEIETHPTGHGHSSHS